MLFIDTDLAEAQRSQQCGWRRSDEDARNQLPQAGLLSCVDQRIHRQPARAVAALPAGDIHRELGDAGVAHRGR